MRNLLKILFVILLGLPFCSFAKDARFLPGNNLDLLTAAHMLGYVFKWYCPEFKKEEGKWYCQGKEFDAPEAFWDSDPRIVAARGIPQNGSATSDKEVTQWFFASALFKDEQNIYTIESKSDHGVFSPLTFEKKPWGGVEIGTTSLAGDVKLSLNEAIACMQGAGFTHPFTSVDIYRPLYPNTPTKDALYAFHGVAPTPVYVGSVSGEVFTDDETIPPKPCHSPTKTIQKQHLNSK